MEVTIELCAVFGYRMKESIESIKMKRPPLKNKGVIRESCFEEYDIRGFVR